MKIHVDQKRRQNNPPEIERTRAYHHYLEMAALAKAMRLLGKVDDDGEQVSLRADQQ